MIIVYSKRYIRSEKRKMAKKHVNTRLLGINLLIFSGLFTLVFIVYTLAFNSFVSDTQMALIILGIMLIMVGGVLVVNSKNKRRRR